MSDIQLEGAEELIAKFEKLGKLEALKEALTKSCLIVERSAKENARKHTGELKRSITSEVTTGDVYEGKVYTNLEYAPYVEFGTGLFAENGGRQNVPWHYKDDEGEWHSTNGMHPQPFMRPALNDNREEILKILEEGLKDD